MKILVKCSIILMALFITSGFTQNKPVKNSAGMTMCYIPAGLYKRGSERINTLGQDFTRCYTNGDGLLTLEQPPHKVFISKPFYLASKEVTIGQFKEFIEATGYLPKSNKSGTVGFKPRKDKHGRFQESPFLRDKAYSWKNPGFKQDDNHPVTGVSFADVKAFCKWLSQKTGRTYRLPTSAEWEYACRAGSNTWFSFGNKPLNIIEAYGNLGDMTFEKKHPDHLRCQRVFTKGDREDGFIFTAPVGSFKPNPWGLYDMHGNVWEWCEDYYSEMFYKDSLKGKNTQSFTWQDPVNDTKSPKAADMRLIRGGSWFTAPMYARSASRGYFHERDAACYLGFRVLMEASQEEVLASKKAFAQEKDTIDYLTKLGVRFSQFGMLHKKVQINTPLSLQDFKKLANISNIAAIEIANKAGVVSDEYIKVIAKLTDLKNLSLQKLQITQGQQQLQPLASLIKLQTLSLAENPSINDTELSFLKSLKNLRQLSLSGKGITDRTMSYIKDCESLTYLNVLGTSISDKGVSSLKTETLQRIKLPELDDAMAISLSQRISLREIFSPKSSLSDIGFKAICKLHNLEYLYLNFASNISPDSFSNLKSLTKLHTLNLAYTKAGDQAVAALKEKRFLSFLEIGSKFLTDTGMKDLGQLYFLTHLTIHKEAINVSDASLASLTKLRKLKQLELYPTQLTIEAANELKELPHFKTLRLTVKK